MRKVLVVGQTPPPLGGQAIMIENFVKGQYQDISIEHVRMDFSEDMDEIGKASFSKVLKLAALIARIWRARFSAKPEVLYYPPAGPDKVPMLRDIVILITCRWLFSKTVFHFHAGGISELYEQLPGWMRWFYRKAYFKPDLAIMLSLFNPRDDKLLQARQTLELHYGIPDQGGVGLRRDNAVPRILYVAVVRESKGILDLIRAVALMKAAGQEVAVDVLGKFVSPEFESDVRKLVSDSGLESSILFHGVKSGEEKWAYYRAADIFCFPTFFESETFGVVLLEAMQCELPLVATRWRGVQSIVREGETGYLVPIHSPEMLAERLTDLANNESLRQEMGKAGRALFELEYQEETWLRRMEKAMADV